MKELYTLRLFGEIDNVPVRDRLFISAENYSEALRKAKPFVGNFPHWAEQSPHAASATCHWSLDLCEPRGLADKLHRDTEQLEQRLAELLAELNATKRELVSLENPIR